MTESTQLTLHRRRVDVDAAGGVESLLKALAPIMLEASADGHAGPFAVVNIGTSTAESVRLFCTANVSAVLTANPTTLVVDLAPEAQYVRFALNGLALTANVAHALSAMLRSMAVVTCGPQVTELRQRLDLLGLLVDGYALQRLDTALAAAGHRLTGATRTLLESAAHGDTVGCLDTLRYELPPVLDVIAVALRHRVPGG